MSPVSRSMRYVIQIVPGKVQGSPRTGRTRAFRQRSQGRSGRKTRARDPGDTAWQRPLPTDRRCAPGRIGRERVASSSALLLELGALLLVLSILGVIASRLSLTPVPLYLLAGLVVGEGGLQLVPTSGSYIQASAQIGVVLLLFMLGVEFSSDEFAESPVATCRPSWSMVSSTPFPAWSRAWSWAWTRSASSPWRGPRGCPRPASSPGCSPTCDGCATRRPRCPRGARARGLRNGDLPSGAGRAGGGRRLVAGARRSARRHGRPARRAACVPPMGASDRRRPRPSSSEQFLLRILIT